jgi:hypothetical protein
MRLPCLLVSLAALALVLAAAAPPADACVGARALAMGGAFVGLADDVSATYWNPAGLIQIEEGARSGTWMRTANHRDEINYKDYVAYALRTGPKSALGISYVNYQLLSDWDQKWFWLSGAYKVGEKTALGLNVRFVNDGVPSGWSADTDTGVDLSLFHKLDKRTSLGLLVQDVNEPESTATDGISTVRAKWIRNVRPGIAFRPREDLVCSLEVYDALDDGHARDIRFGVEKRFGNQALRAGYYGDTNDITVGMGWMNESGATDITLLTGDLDNTILVSATWNFAPEEEWAF